MATISKLKAILTLDNKQFESGIKSSEKSTKAFSKNIASIGAAIGIAFGAKQLLDFGVQLAKIGTTSLNVGKAFDKLGISIKSLQLATNFGVSELRLKQMAVQAVNLGVSADKLATYFEFATIRAAETGESIDYLVNSIVIGIGRQSRLVLDNLGIGLAELNAEIVRTGDFATAANNIIQRNLTDSAVSTKDATDAVTQLNVAWEDLTEDMANKFGPTISRVLLNIGSLLTDNLNQRIRAMSSQELINEANRMNNAIAGTDLFGDDTEYKKYLNKLEEELKRRTPDFKKLSAAAFGFPTGMYPDRSGGGVPGLVPDPIERNTQDNLTTLSSLGPDTLPVYKELTSAALIGGFSTTTGKLLEMSDANKKLALSVKEVGDNYAPTTEEMKAFTDEMKIAAGEAVAMGDILTNVTGMAIQSFASALLNAIETGDILGAFSSFLSSLGSLLVQYGSALVAMGIGQTLMEKGDAVAKIVGGGIIIAAGVGLAAAGKAIKKGGATGSFGGSGSYGSYGSYGGGSYGGGGYSYEREVVLVARGKDLVGVLNRQNANDYNNGGI